MGPMWVNLYGAPENVAYSVKNATCMCILVGIACNSHMRYLDASSVAKAVKRISRTIRMDSKNMKQIYNTTPDKVRRTASIFAGDAIAV